MKKKVTRGGAFVFEILGNVAKEARRRHIQRKWNILVKESESRSSSGWSLDQNLHLWPRPLLCLTSYVQACPSASSFLLKALSFLIVPHVGLVLLDQHCMFNLHVGMSKISKRNHLSFRTRKMMISQELNSQWISSKPFFPLFSLTLRHNTFPRTFKAMTAYGLKCS